MNYLPRPYQSAAAASFRSITGNGVPSALVELPTGCGKTVTFSMLAEETVLIGKRVLVVAHRKTLIEQLAREINKATGIDVGVWMGQTRERLWAPIVVCSKDTIYSKMEQMDASEFGLVVIDEAHHAKNGSRYDEIRTWAQAASVPVLGTTATPDRTDKSPLVGDGRPFAELAYRYPIWQWDGPSAINDGWLVPINQEHVHIDGLDFTKIADKAAWTDEEIEEIVSAEGVPMQMADALVKTMGERPTIVFCPTVKHAYLMGELIDRYAGSNVTVVIHSEHPEYKITDDERRKREKLYLNGERQFLVNVGVATEGFDAPHTAGIGVLRPLKSRLLFAQMVGRGTRLFLGINPAELIDMEAEERRAAIAASDKPNALVVGFYSKLADLKLWTNLEDVLGEDLDDELVERSRKITAGDTTEKLKKARTQIEAEAAFLAADTERRRKIDAERRKTLVPAAAFRRQAVNCYATGAIRDVGGDEVMDRELKTAVAGATPSRPSLKQAKLAVMLGLKPSHVIRMNRKQVSGYIGERFQADVKPDYRLLKGVSRSLQRMLGGD